MLAFFIRLVIGPFHPTLNGPSHPALTRLQFAIGEFDMVVVDPVAITTEIYEIKHSAEKVPEQYKNLTDKEKCRETEFRFGAIMKKVVQS